VKVWGEFEATPGAAFFHKEGPIQHCLVFTRSVRARVWFLA
jgi:hypothetical protein